MWCAKGFGCCRTKSSGGVDGRSREGRLGTTRSTAVAPTRAGGGESAVEVAAESPPEEPIDEAAAADSDLSLSARPLHCVSTKTPNLPTVSKESVFVFGEDQRLPKEDTETGSELTTEDGTEGAAQQPTAGFWSKRSVTL
ncbi:unnamed protein product [Vitrella brassicaformis CCMP3155]|uniref:Uncharacterized protein n=1 Tax=Vitrella brassicaformis (strain CCMP3155) TaxID=1169540 RepID=A0A0G4EJX8_VITBC|nr:unnamed protein product [Vitrella brassicaformis CCMP3155]|eukprot:CEL96704.1 unnamed protein product [Vitrella brassicaformis CCMP3155]